MGEKGRGYYLKKEDDTYVVKPTILAPGGVKKNAESAYGEEYWSYAIPSLRPECRSERCQGAHSSSDLVFGSSW